MLALQETKERTGPVSAVQRFIIGPGQGQCDQNGRFFMFLVTNSLSKVGQIFW